MLISRTLLSSISHTDCSPPHQRAFSLLFFNFLAAADQFCYFADLQPTAWLQIIVRLLSAAADYALLSASDDYGLLSACHAYLDIICRLCDFFQGIFIQVQFNFTLSFPDHLFVSAHHGQMSKSPRIADRSCVE